MESITVVGTKDTSIIRKGKRKHKAINFKNYKLMKIRYFSIS